MADFIQIHPRDTVAVALRDIPVGTEFMGVKALETIPQGHKMALVSVQKDAPVIKYGFPIGHATQTIIPGAWVHTHNLATNLSGESDYTYCPEFAAPKAQTPMTFQGYLREDGRAGVRNELWIIPTVGCVNDVAKALARENSHLATGTIDGVYAFCHPFGCSQTGEDHAQTRKLLAALAHHPNAGGVLVLSLGCENLTQEQFREELGEFDPRRIKFLTCQQVADEMEAGSELLEELAQYAAGFTRQTLSADKLVIGMKCGGSDGLSGITANPVTGVFSDLLVAQGGTTVLTEVPEMFGAEDILLNRCVTREVFQKAADMLQGFKDYFTSHHETVYENPSPGNKAGGITTLEDKSCGCVQKGGSAPVVDVLQYGQQVSTQGLHMLCGPGNDLVSATALTAAGAQIIIFTTGRGTPFGAPAPTLKVSTNTPLAQKKSGWIDFNAGVVADGSQTLTQAAQGLLEKVLATASGEQTKSEQQGFREISIWKDGVVL